MARRTLAQRQYSLTCAYNRAVSRVNELQAKGYKFRSSTMKALSSETLAKKSESASMKDINYYKQLAKISVAKSKATGYTYEEGKKTRTVSVAEGNRIERRKKKLQKKQDEITSQMTSNYYNLEYVEDEISSLADENIVEDTHGRKHSVVYSEGKQMILDSISELKELGLVGISDRSAETIIEELTTLQRIYHQDQVDNVLTHVNSIIQSYYREGDEGNLVPVLDETMDLTGTRYEGYETGSHEGIQYTESQALGLQYVINAQKNKKG